MVLVLLPVFLSQERRGEKEEASYCCSFMLLVLGSESDLMRVEEQEPALPLLCASAAAPAYAPGNLVIGLGACRHAAS
jgi:hypothetical protein